MSNVVEFTSLIAPDGDEFLFDSDTRWLMSEDGLGFPDIEYLTSRAAGQHGETVLGFRLNPRIVQMQLRESTGNRFDYWTARHNLLNILRPNRLGNRNFATSVLRKKFPDGSIRDLNVVVEKGPGFAPRDLTRWDEWGYTETIRFIAHYPIFYNPVPTSVTFDLSAYELGLLSFPATFPISFGSGHVTKSEVTQCLGTWDSYPTIVITGPVEGFRLDNDSTEESLEFERDVQDGEVITINLEFGNKRITDASGNILNGILTSETARYFSRFHIGHDPEVTDGNNTLSFYGRNLNETSEVVVSFNDSYIGL